MWRHTCPPLDSASLSAELPHSLEQDRQMDLPLRNTQMLWVNISVVYKVSLNQYVISDTGSCSNPSSWENKLFTWNLGLELIKKREAFSSYRLVLVNTVFLINIKRSHESLSHGFGFNLLYLCYRCVKSLWISLTLLTTQLQGLHLQSISHHYPKRDYWKRTPLMHTGGQYQHTGSSQRAPNGFFLLM